MLLDEGKRLGGEGEYAAAIEKYQTLVEDYPDSEYDWEAKELAAECYFNWAEELENELKYDEAAEKYQKVLDYPQGTEFWDDAKRGMGECYYESGQNLQSQKHYAEAIIKYQSVPFTSSGSYERAEEAVAECYYEWGIDLQSQNNFTGAISKYQSAIDAPYSEYRSQAREAIGECCYEWVSQLVAAEKYEEAIEKYLVLIEKHASTSWASSEKADVLSDIPPDVLFTCATNLQQNKSYDGAIRLYETLLLYHPESELATEAEKARIETEIAKIAEGEHGYLPPPPALTPQQLEGQVEYEIVNDTPYTLTVLLSGPTTRSLILVTQASETITLEPGDYKVAAKVDALGVTPYYGETTLLGDYRYESRFYIG
jgi:tetratricopeptide (TPR) repeat protein